ncbi:enoyl-CoA hydratase-related protein [Cryptosporangium aurantiacum]|uniref:Putative two-component system protein, hydrogenase maturation factor HypX/HoxX n=1 Tax=Cryptosporangium aurantiacum TaxID=134849 RepID=A0A1M7NQX3_9ACTN|nr:enoyl-CoA hydratase-related protein [Cryptosporangium aurantiacum]SHN06389.1 putative two-component system protein, hydrogenase maturation factor HypX/HoxX [Cryptosporangium aurantiacum]
MRSLLLTFRRRSNSRPKTQPKQSPRSLRILLLVSSFNGLTQRVWCALRDQGHTVAVEFARDAESIADAARRADPELILCPFLKERVPTEVWQKWTTVIIHPGPVGDRGPSSLDWAITEGRSEWGVTALQAVEEMDAGPVWATRTFSIPIDPPTKSSLYNGPVTDAAMSCIEEVLAKISDPDFRPTPLERLAKTHVRPTMRQTDRAFSWDDPAEAIVRKIRAADGAPGVRTEIAGVGVWAFDAHIGPRQSDPPGTVVACRDGAVLVAAGTGSVWLGHLKSIPDDAERATNGVKLPAALVLGDHLPEGLTAPTPAAATVEHCGPGRIHYVRRGEVGYVILDCYNGALSTEGCNQALHVLRHAIRQDTLAIVLRGGSGPFCNGIDLNRIEATVSPANPAAEAWANITAINDVCRELIMCRSQVTIAAYSGSAGAGGVMLPLGADLVVARDGVVLNPFYEMGLTGSELHTYTLPRRVGPDAAKRLLSEKLPVGVAEAERLGMVDEVGPRDPGPFGNWLHEVALRYRDEALRERTLRRKANVLDRDLSVRPLDAYEARELGEMAQDMFDDRHGFDAARRAFVRKEPPTRTPARLALHRAPGFVRH